MTRHPDPPAGVPELMTPGEVAAAFRVDPETPRRWADAGKLRYIRTPGAEGPGNRRYYAAQVRAIIAGTPLTSEQLDLLVRGEEPRHG